MLKIIHVSDFHLERESVTYQKKAIVEALVTDLQLFVDDKTILIFTGDLIDKGGFAFTDSDLAFLTFEEVFVEPILRSIPLLRNRIFFVPGNHDVVRSKIHKIVDAGLAATLSTADKVDHFIEENRFSSEYLGRLADYKTWECSFYKGYPEKQLSNFENSFKVNINGKIIGITAINSSWLCKDDSDKENLIIGKNQIENSLEFIDDCDFKIAVLHHPLEFFKGFDIELVRPLLFKHYDIMLTGHVHSLDSEYNSNLYGKIFVSTATSTIADRPSERKYANGYSVIYYNSTNIIVEHRKYLDDHQNFVPNTDIGTANGCKSFDILTPEEVLHYNSNLVLITAIENRVVESLNDHILMAGNNTSVSCTIENIFVEPRILNNPKDSLKKEDTISYTIESILTSNSNFLIYGSKESGKTLLIDKIFIDALKKFSSTDYLPILFRFKDFKKDIKRLLREYFAVSATEIDDFIHKNKFLFLIDDIYFKNGNNDKLFELIEFIKDRTNIRLVCTANQALDNTIPTEYLEYNSIFNFNICFIQDFGSKEIKALVGKWFAGKNYDMQEKMEKLLKSFYDFKLPKTPLSATLFLWIFERQEKKPINNSVLVEIFIENLLEKTNIENIYSDSFDFTNKKRLLSFMAKYMRDNGDADLSYSVDYTEMLNFVTQYLKKKFPGKPERILEDFISRGLFIYEEDNKLRFKTAFIFHFFLSLQLDYNPDFRKHVFTDDNYLNYTEEIEYYTGLKRDNLDILTFTQEKLHVAFDEFNEDIRQNYDKIDSVLETKGEKSITFQIDERKTRKKITEEKFDQIFDKTLARTPTQQNIPKKEVQNLDTKYNVDKILKLASVVLKNCEDIDDFNLKKKSYQHILESSISFLMQYRDSLIMLYLQNNREPDFFPKNINFHLFIRVLPLIHQNVLHSWLGSQKMRPVIEEKINEDLDTLNISELEKFMSVFINGDIRGNKYPEIIKGFVKSSKFNYIKDLSFLKVLSYYHLRKNNIETDKLYLSILAEIKTKLGQLANKKKGDFIAKIKKGKTSRK